MLHNKQSYALDWYRLIGLERASIHIDYTWIDEPPISLRTQARSIFDPTTIIPTINNNEDEEEIEDTVPINSNKCHTLHVNNNNNKMKQLNMGHFIRNNEKCVSVLFFVFLCLHLHCFLID